MSRSTRGRNHILLKLRWHTPVVGLVRYVPMVRRMILAGRDLIVRCRGVVRPGLFRHDELGNCLMHRVVVQWEGNGKRAQNGRTSKSCRFKISESEGRASIRSR